MRLLHKVETYNSDTEETHMMAQDTVGTYKPSGNASAFVQGKKFGDDNARLGGEVRMIPAGEALVCRYHTALRTRFMTATFFLLSLSSRRSSYLYARSACASGVALSGL